uniref:DOMON domain-containing protein n=1 Tax=Halisarca dujardinii TaxID=2583056 RepID=A0AA96MKK0_HALDU|nr:DOMON domain-containing protein [Halisarca dujardinii]
MNSVLGVAILVGVLASAAAQSIGFNGNQPVIGDTTVTFSWTFTGVTADGFTCSLNGGTATSCQSPHVVQQSDLLNGKNTLAVIALFGNGQSLGPLALEVTVSQSSSSNQVQFKGLAPVVGDNGVSFSWELTGASADKFTCSLNGATAEDCSSPFSVAKSGLSDGLNTLAVTAVVGGQNVGPVNLEVTVSKSSSSNQVQFSGQTPVVGDNDVSFSWELTGASADKFTCSLNGATAEDCSSPFSVAKADLSDGLNTLAVTAVVGGQNVGPVNLEVTVSQSSSSNQVKFSGQTPVVGDNDVSFSWELTGATADKFTCSLNGGAAVDCTSPHSVSKSALQAGSNTLSVTAIVSGLVLDPLDFTVSSGGDSVQFNGEANLNGNSVEFTWSVTGVSGVTYQCSLNGEALFACSSGHSVALSALQDGENVLSVTASGEGVSFSGPLELKVTKSFSVSTGTLSANGGAYSVAYTIHGDVVSFVVSAETTGWVGLGFSEDQLMPNSDVVVGAADSDGGMFVFDGFANALAQPPVDSQQDITDFSATHEGGMTTVTFSRKLVTGDSDDDLPVTKSLYWLWAYGGSFSGSDPTSIGYHFTNRGVFPSNMTLSATAATASFSGSNGPLTGATSTPTTGDPPVATSGPGTTPAPGTVSFSGNAESSGNSVVFTWSVTGVSGVTYQCSFNGEASFVCTSPYTVDVSSDPSVQDGLNVLSVTASGGGVTFESPLELSFTKFHSVEAPVLSSPTVHSVDVPVLPSPAVHSVEAPVLPSPAVHSVEAPVPSSPTVHSVDVPVLPSLAVHSVDVSVLPSPAVHSVDAPVLSSPTVHSVEAPVLSSLTVHSVDVPVLPSPAVHSVDAPVLSSPTVHSVEAPVLSSPTVHSVEAPVLSSPTVHSVDVPVLSPPIIHSVDVPVLTSSHTDLPSYRILHPPNFTWGSLDGRDFDVLINDAYNEVVHWKHNVFEVPRGKAGNSFVAELCRLLEQFADDTAMECISMRAAMTIPALLLQKPHRRSTSKDHISCLERRLKCWLAGDIQSLLHEGRSIQNTLDKMHRRKKNDTASISRSFENLVSKGNIKAAIRLITEQNGRGCLPLRGEQPDGRSVKDHLLEKHPSSQPVDPTALSDCTPAPIPHPTFYDQIDGPFIRSIALHMSGSAGPSGLDAKAWKRLCSAFHNTSKDLCNALAKIARKICTTFVDPQGLEAFTACRLIALDKDPGVRPIGVGETVRRLISKAILRVTKVEIQKVAGSSQLCAAESSGNSVEFTWSVTGVSGVTYQCSFNGGDPFVCTSPYTVDVSDPSVQDGLNVLSVTASGGGVTFESPLELSFTKSESSGNSVEFTWSVTGVSGVTYQCSFNGGDPFVCTSPYTVDVSDPSVQDGLNVLSVTASGGGVTFESPLELSFTKSVSTTSSPGTTPTPGTVTFSGNAESSGNSVEFTWSVTGVSGVTYQCSFNGGDPFVCSSSYTVDVSDPSVQDGLNVLSVTASGGGVTFESPLELSFTKSVSTTSSPGTTPTPGTVSFSGNAESSGNSVEFTWSVTGVSGVTYQCSFNGGDPFVCSSPYTVDVSDPSVQDGLNVLSVTASGGGVTFESPLELSFTKSVSTTSSPGTTPTPGTVSFSGNAESSGNSVEFTWSVTGVSGVTYQCSFNGGDPFVCSSPYTVDVSDPSVQDGLNVLSVTASGGGVTFESPLELSFTKSESSGNSVEFTWSVTGVSGVTYQCSFNGGDPFVCTSPYTVDVSSDPSVQDGLNVLSVTASGGGVTFESPLELSFTKSESSGNAVEFTWSVTGVSGVTYQCSFNGGDPFVCTSPYTVDVSSDPSVQDGLNVLSVTASGGGVTFESPLELSFTKTVTPTSEPGTVPAQTSEPGTVPAQTSEPGTVPAQTSDPGPISTPTSSPGTPTPGSVTFSGNAESSGNSVEFTWSAVTGVSGVTYQCSFNGGDPFVCTSPYTVDVSDPSVQDGLNVLSVTASGGGVTFESPLELSFTRIEAVGGSVVFRWSFTGATDLPLMCSLNGGEFFDCQSPYEVDFSDLPDGDNVLTVVAKRGEDEVARGSVTFTKLTTTPEEGAGSVTVEWETDPDLTYKCFLNDELRNSCTSPFELSEEEQVAATTVVRVESFRGEMQVRVVGETVVESCRFTGISSPDRAYLWPEGYAMFSWTSEGNVEENRCTLGGGADFPCQSGLHFNVSAVTAGTHRGEVIAYCQGKPIGREVLRFRAQSGIPRDPDNCARLLVSDHVATYNRSASTVTVAFSTNIPSSCVCRLPADNRRAIQSCELKWIIVKLNVFISLLYV